MNKVLDACMQTLAENKDRKAARIAACELFIKKLTAQKGEVLNLHLSEMVLDKKRHTLKVSFEFPLLFESPIEGGGQ